MAQIQLGEIFLKILNMGIAAGWLILAVLALRLILKKIPKWLACVLWGIVAIRLVWPFSIESVFSLIPSAEVLPEKVITGNTFQVDTGFSLIDHSVNDYLGDHYCEGVSAPAGFGDHVMTALGGIWLAVLFLLLAYGVFSYVRLRSKVREAAWLRDNIWLCDAVKTPFILGMVKPRIYLPSSIHGEQEGFVLAHERAHLKRRDHWWKPLGYMLLTIYWFHPLVWIAYLLLCRDIELACDEKVIRDMDINEKKRYSETLVSCSMERRMIMACPLAFGEIGVKERVKAVLNYKKPGFWLILAAAAACVAVAVCFLTNPKEDTFDISIVIPAGGEGPFYYSGEEISPNRSKITLSSGEGLGDTEVVLISGIITEAAEENVYGPTYMTPGMPVKMNVDKGAWFRVGVAMSNPTNEDIVVYVRVKGVEVRIADSAEGKLPADPVLPDLSEAKENENGVGTSLAQRVDTDAESAITTAILERYASSYPDEYDFACCDFIILKELSATPTEGDTTQTITFYGWALYQKCNISEQGIEDLGSTHLPLALTFELNDSGYHLKEYWEPGSGSYFVSDVRDKFPADIAEDGTDSQKFVIPQIQSCYKQAILFSGLDTEAVIAGLLYTICNPDTSSDPDLGMSSNPGDYIAAHFIEYRELIYYGEYTLRYCFKQFEKGDETGLGGKIMAHVCEEILQTEGQLPVDAGTATGQIWYDTLKAHAGNKVEPFLD